MLVKGTVAEDWCCLICRQMEPTTFMSKLESYRTDLNVLDKDFREFTRKFAHSYHGFKLTSLIEAKILLNLLQ